MKKVELLNAKNDTKHFDYTCTKDFRANGYPCDDKSKPLYLSSSEEDYIGYIEWLADYIVTLDLEPIEEQIDLCKEIKFHPLYLADAFRAIDHIAFDYVYGSGRRGRCNKDERDVRKKFWPRRFGRMPDDVTCRVPLSIVLKKIESHAERVTLLRSYFSEVGELIDK